MKLYVILAALICFHQDGSSGLPAWSPQGPEGPLSDKRSPTGEPQPPSTDGIVLPELKAPAPPPESARPQPPAPPDPHLLELFNKNPEGFPAAYAKFQMQKNSQKERRALDSVKRRGPSYNQFITAGVVTGLNLQQRSAYTMFAPSDTFLQSRNISLPIMALKDLECVRHIVRSHTVLGRLTLTQGIEDATLSLSEAPIFFNAKEVNGVEILRANNEADYGIVHVINGWLMDQQRMMDVCPSLQPSGDDVQLQLVPSSSNVHSISLRGASDDDDIFSAGLNQLSSIKPNDINDLLNPVEPYVVVPFTPDSPNDYSSLSDANVDVLLSSIDHFATAWTKMSDAEDGVIGTLQSLGASTFLALLERSNLLETLGNNGPWTVFAPDNDAWQALPSASFDHIMKDQVLLKQILSYHIVPGNVTRRSFSNGQTLSSLHEGYPIHMNLYSDGRASWYTASGSMIKNLDELAGNGVVHVITAALFPPLGDLYSTVRWTPALQRASEWLSTSSFKDDGLSGGITAFLPEDGPLLNAFLSQLNPFDESDIWRQHLVRGTWFTSGLIDGDQHETLGGSKLMISHNGDCLAVNGSCIVVRDITLTNGVLHVLQQPIHNVNGS